MAQVGDGGDVFVFKLASYVGYKSELFAKIAIAVLSYGVIAGELVVGAIGYVDDTLFAAQVAGREEIVTVDGDVVSVLVWVMADDWGGRQVAQPSLTKTRFDVAQGLFF